MSAAQILASPDAHRIYDAATAYFRLHLENPLNSTGMPTAGKLLLCPGLGDRGLAYSVAMSIAGGTFLGIESRSARLKEALRNSVCDYMVNSLDEALRVLKNEIRRRAPVSVGLLGDPGEVLNEALERGVQPEYVMSGTREDGASMIKPFLENGAIDLTGDSHHAPAHSTEAPVLVLACASAPEVLRAFEAAVTHLFPTTTPNARSRWADASRQYFRRTAPPLRSALLNDEEATALSYALSQHISAGTLVAVSRRLGEPDWRQDAHLTL